MVKIKVLKHIARTIEPVKNAILNYVLTGGASVSYTNSPFAIYVTFELDRDMFFLYSQFSSSQCSIDGVQGTFEIPVEKLETEYIDGRKLSEITAPLLIKDGKALCGFFIKDYGQHSQADLIDDSKLRWFMQFAEPDFSNFYTTKEESDAKIAEYLAVDKDEIMAMLKEELKLWMIERGLNELMENFATATKTELQNFVIEYYNL